MNKLIIPIIVVLILAAGIGAFFIFQKPTFPQSAIGQCGDGICGLMEKEKGICPKDCEMTSNSNENILEKNNNNSTTKTKNDAPAISNNDFEHPFSVWGISNIYSKDNLDEDIKYMNDLGIASFKAHTTVSLGLYQGKDPWSFADITISEAKKYGIEPIFTITPLKGLSEKDNQLPKTQADMDIYKKYVGDVVARYKDNVDTWEVVNELSSHWNDSWENYAKLLMVTVEEIRKIQPSAKIVMPGPAIDLFKTENSDPDSVEIILKNLEKNTKWFDYFDPHFIGSGDPSSAGKDDRYLDMIEWTNYYKPILKKYGYENVGWFTEIKTSGGEGFSTTEKDQAVDLIKKYIVGIALGYDQIHNNGQIMQTESKKWSHEYRKYDGLIDAESNKKLAYYSTKKIIDVLTGFDKLKTATIKQNEDGVYIYKFTESGKNIWVAWSDNSSNKQITISGIKPSSVKTTEAVPRYETGKEVTDYNTAFNTEIKTVKDGKVSMVISDVPVFVEE